MLRINSYTFGSHSFTRKSQSDCKNNEFLSNVLKPRTNLTLLSGSIITTTTTLPSGRIVVLGANRCVSLFTRVQKIKTNSAPAFFVLFFVLRKVFLNIL